MTTMCELMRSVPWWLFYDTGSVNRRKSVLLLASFTPFSSPEAALLFGQHQESRPLAMSNDIPFLNGFVKTIDWDHNQSDLSDLTLNMRRVTESPWIADFRCWTWPEVAIFGAGQKERCLWGREWFYSRHYKIRFQTKTELFCSVSKKICVHTSFSYRFRPSALQRRIRFENAFISSVRMLKWTRRMRISIYRPAKFFATFDSLLLGVVVV